MELSANLSNKATDGPIIVRAEEGRVEASG